MFRAEVIREALSTLIGWRQSYDTSNLQVAEALTESESGLYYQDVHPLLTLENLSCIAPDFKNTTYPAYTQGMSVKKGQIIKVDNVCYRAKVAMTQAINPQDDTDKEYWVETDPFSEWLANKTNASLLKGITRFVNEKVIKGTYKTLVEKKTLFDGTGRIYDTIENKNNLVGFEIVPIRAKGVTTIINKIGLQFTQPGVYNIYIMHSSCSDPVYSFEFIKTKSNAIEWFTPNEKVYLPYESDEINAGGSWYICYMQSTLPTNSQAIRKERDWSAGPCKACSRVEFESWKLWSRYLEVHPFYVNEENLVAVNGGEPQMWDVQDNLYIYDTNFGLNLDVTVECDITDFIIEQKMMLQDFLSKQVAIDFLREFAYNASVRTNRHSINASRLDILYEIDGDSSSMKKSGLSYQLEQSLKAVELSTEGIDRVCLPCKNNGIKYRTV